MSHYQLVQHLTIFQQWLVFCTLSLCLLSPLTLKARTIHSSTLVSAVICISDVLLKNTFESLICTLNIISTVFNRIKHQENPLCCNNGIFFLCAAVTVKVVDERSFENNATILLQVGNITSEFTINYAPCSETSNESYISNSSTPDLEIHLVNLSTETTYCYSITADSNTVVTGSCKGKITTTAEDTSVLPPTTSSITAEDTSVLPPTTLSISGQCDSQSVKSLLQT